MACSLLKIRFVLIILLSIICNNTLAETLILSAAPRESAKQGHNLYGPLAKHLSQLLGREVKFKHAKHWLRYQSDIKKRKYDFVFDGPHLTGKFGPRGHVDTRNAQEDHIGCPHEQRRDISFQRANLLVFCLAIVV